MFGILRPESPDEQMPMSPETSPPPPRSMAPMPASQYSSREELLNHAKDWAAHQGYAIVIARSRFNRLWLKCDRGGQYENRRNLTPDQRKRKRGDSRLLGCPFKMLAIVRKDGIWKVHTEVPDHNHGPSDDLSQHPTLRRLTDAQTQKVNDMTDAGNSPAETLDELRKLWPDIKVLTRDIYNARKKYKTQKEMAEMAAGLPEEQPYEDPNETFPGPTPNGRWEWVPDGEEVTNKSRKRKRRPPVEQQNLDPQLQSSNPSQPHQFPPNNSVSPSESQYMRQLQDHSVLNGQNRNMLSGFERRDSGPGHIHAPSSFASADESPDLMRSLDEDPSLLAHHSHVPNPTTPSRLRSQYPTRPAVETAIMSSTTSPATAQTLSAALAGAPKAQSGQVIMSRIERMEKEQRDQKNMLAQILGVVQGIHTGGR